MKTYKLIVVPLLAALLLPVACDQGGSSVEVKEQKEDPNLPPAQVDLPEPPPPNAFVIKEKNDDGTFRVEGLIEYKDKNLGQKVETRAIIASISPDCDPGKAKKEGTKCPEPHLFIKDSAEADKRMLVVGYPKGLPKERKLEVGDTYTFKGDYKEMAAGFVATEDGLLLADEIDGESVLEED